jgi:hypothetical protein
MIIIKMHTFCGHPLKRVKFCGHPVKSVKFCGHPLKRVKFYGHPLKHAKLGDANIIEAVLKRGQFKKRLIQILFRERLRIISCTPR